MGNLKVFLVIGFGLLAFCWCKEGKTQQNVHQSLIEECAAKLTIEMGQHSFSIVRGSGFIFTDNGKVKDECIEKTIESDQITYRPRYFFGKQGRKEGNFVVSLTISNRENIHK